MKMMQKFYLLSAMCLLAASPVQALVRNGSFEDIPAGKSIPRHWQLATAFAGKVDSGAAEGEKCFKLDGKDGSGILIQSLKLQPGKTYTLSWQVKADKAEQGKQGKKRDKTDTCQGLGKSVFRRDFLKKID